MSGNFNRMKVERIIQWMDVQGGRDDRGVWDGRNMLTERTYRMHTRRGGGGGRGARREALRRKACCSFNNSVCPVWRNGKPRSLARSVAPADERNGRMSARWIIAANMSNDVPSAQTPLSRDGRQRQLSLLITLSPSLSLLCARSSSSSLTKFVRGVSEHWISPRDCHFEMQLKSTTKDFLSFYIMQSIT